MDKRRITKGATGAAATVLALGALQGASARADAGVDGETASAATTATTATTAPTVCVGTQPEGSLPHWGPKGNYPDDTPLYRVMKYISETAKDYPGAFTGFSIDDANHAMDMYRISPEESKEAKDLDADICAAAEKGVTIRLHDTDVTEKELKALVDRIGGDMDRWKGTLMIWGVGMDTHSVVVGVSDPAKAEPVLREAYGAEAMRHIKIEQSEQAVTLDLGR
ncbi:hypothetical protein [Streptomyces sp. NPDC002845]